MLSIALRDAQPIKYLPSGRINFFLLAGTTEVVVARLGLPRGVRFLVLDIVNETAVVICCGLAVLSAIRAKNGGACHQCLTAGWLVALGRYSYGLYVIHGMLRPQLFRWYDVTTLHIFPGSPLIYQVSFYLFSSLISFGLAVLSYHGIERPFLSLKRFVDYRQYQRKSYSLQTSK